MSSSTESVQRCTPLFPLSHLSPLRTRGDRYLRFHPTTNNFGSVIASMAYLSPSRPKPESLMPPYGILSMRKLGLSFTITATTLTPFKKGSVGVGPVMRSLRCAYHTRSQRGLDHQSVAPTYAVLPCSILYIATRAVSLTVRLSELRS